MAKKKLYYTIERELDDNGDELTLTGNKTITVYNIINNKPRSITGIFCGSDKDNVKQIKKYLLKNDYDVDNIKLIYL